jgi:acyl transferase domain-containing protein
MRKDIVFLFSGQGSQYYHMGEKLFRNEHIFRYWMIKANTYLFNNYNIDFINKLYHPNKTFTDVFDDLKYTHVSIFVTQYAFAQWLLSKHIHPSYLLGSSLGEFVAITLAGCIELTTALELIIEQALLIDQCFPAANMIAIFENKSVYNNSEILYKHSEIVSYNFHHHFVICCISNKTAQIKNWLDQQNTTYQLLSINKPFHTSIIDNYKQQVMNILHRKNFILSAPKIPIISCVTGKPLEEISLSHLWKIIREPVFFENAINNYIKRQQKSTLIDISPSGTCATFCKYIVPDRDDVYQLMTPYNTFNDNYSVLKKALLQ